MPAWLQRSAAAAISILPRNETLKRGLHSLDISDRMRRYQNVLSLMPAEKIDGLFRDGVLAEDAGDEVLKCWDDFYDLTEDTTELGAFQFLELRSTLPDELLMYADKLSMAHGLEVRVPYLDKEIVEFAERLAPSFKLRWGAQKWIHRRVCREIIPADVLRRKKRGFAVNVVDDWFRDRARNTVAEVLLDHDSKIFGFLSPCAVKGLIEQHESGRNDNHKILFSLVVLEQWLRAQSLTSVPA
jgi:asparagine synthase (glutamine-hydrolysing)